MPWAAGRVLAALLGCALPQLIWRSLGQEELETADSAAPAPQARPEGRPRQTAEQRAALAKWRAEQARATSVPSHPAPLAHHPRHHRPSWVPQAQADEEAAAVDDVPSGTALSRGARIDRSSWPVNKV